MIVFLGLILLITVLFCFYSTKRPPNYPPGPRPLPIIGNYLQLPDDDSHCFLFVKKMAEQYGPIIGLKVGHILMIFVDGADNVLEALRREEFQSRPENLLSFTVRTFEKNLGLFFSNGEQWTSSRKFVMRNLKGYGKNRNEHLIVEEIDRLLDTFQDGAIVKGDGVFSLSAVNVIWKMVTNTRLDLEDQVAKRFLNNIRLAFRQGNAAGIDIVNFLPGSRYFSSKFKFAQSVFKETQDFIRKSIREHEEVLDANNPVDLIDYYLIEMIQKKDSKFFSEEDLISTALDFFTAGAESTSNTIEFILTYMLLYPQTQAKMQDEMNRVLNRNRKPVLEDKSNMPYTMAVITEVERLNSIAPTNAVHSCLKDTTFAGYFIPKGTIISMNLRSLGYDEKYWKNPEDFYPERFIKEDGTFFKPAMLATFGLGQRQCVGEVIARNIIFLFTASFFEKFSISVPPGDPQPSTVPLPGITSAPQPFNILIKSRY